MAVPTNIEEFCAAKKLVRDELVAIQAAFDTAGHLTDIDSLDIPTLMSFGLSGVAASMWMARIDLWVNIRTRLAAVVAEGNIP